MAFGKTALSLFVSNGFHTISHIFVLVICSRVLAPIEYGSYRQFFTVYELAVPVLGMGLSQAIFYFYARSKSRQEVFWIVFKILFFTNLLFAVAVAIFGRIFSEAVFHSEILANCLPALVPFTFASLLLPVLWATFVDTGKVKSLAVFNTLYVLLLALIVSAVAFYLKDVFYILVARTLLVCFFVIVLFFYLRKDLFGASFEAGKGGLVSEYRVVDILKYSVPLGGASAAAMLSQQIDKIIVSYFSTPEIFAIYANGAMEIPLIAIFTGALATASISDLSRKVKDHKIEDALVVFRSIASTSALILIPALVYFQFCAEDFMVFLFGNQYIESAAPFRIYLLLIPARLVFFGPVLIAFGKTKQVLQRSSIELILTTLTGVLLTKYFGYQGAAFSIVIVTYCWSVAFNIKQLRACFAVTTRELLPYKQIGKKLIISLLAVPVLFLPSALELTDVKLRILASFSIYSVSILILFYIFRDSDFVRVVSFIKNQRT